MHRNPAAAGPKVCGGSRYNEPSFMVSRMLRATISLQRMNMATLWTSDDSENKDTFHITTVQSIERRA